MTLEEQTEAVAWLEHAYLALDALAGKQRAASGVSLGIKEFLAKLKKGGAGDTDDEDPFS
jgi:hypothetical protein